MSIKILTKTGEEVTHIDDARAYNFDAGNRSGIVKGAYNEGRFYAVTSNVIGLDSCELRIAGHRIVIDSAESITLSNKPSTSTRYSMIAEVVVNDSSTPSFRLFIQPSTTALIKDNLYKTAKGNGTYQIEIGRFTLTPSGLIEDVVRTADVITGGTSGGDNTYIEIGTVTTNTISQGSQANVDVENVVDEQTGKTKTNFNFDIPATAGTTISVNGEEQKNISFKADPQTQLNQISNPNLLINGDFRVNQRKQASYTGQIYGFDRWKSENADLTVRETGNGVELTSVAHAYYLQFIEKYWFLAGKTVTLSVKVNGTIYHSTVALPSSIAGGSYGNFGIPNGSVYLYKYPNTDAFAFTVAIAENSVINVEWCKLEISNVPTTFIPRLYAEELALCQRYYMEIVLQACDYGTSNHTMFPMISLPVTMRVIPSIPENLTIYINGNGQYVGLAESYSISSRFANGVYINIANQNIQSAYIYGVYGEGFKLDAEIYLNRV